MPFFHPTNWAACVKETNMLSEATDVPGMLSLLNYTFKGRSGSVSLSVSNLPKGTQSWRSEKWSPSFQIEGPVTFYSIQSRLGFYFLFLFVEKSK